MWTDGHTDTKKLIIVFRNFANATKKMYPVCFLARQPPTPPFPAGQVHLILEVSRSHTTTHHSRYDSSSQRPSQHSQHTFMPPPTRGIRTHNSNRREAADLRLRPRGHWDRQKKILYLTLNLLTWKIWWANNASRWQMGFNLLTPNVNYIGRTAPLTSKVAFYIFIQQM